MAAAALLALTVKAVAGHNSSTTGQVPVHADPVYYDYPSVTGLLRDISDVDTVHVTTTTATTEHRGRHEQEHRHRHALSPKARAKIAEREVTPAEFTAWSKVNECEEGGDWHVSGPEYSGGLGISNANWVNYGGEFFTHTAATATPDEQIVVAMRIQKNPPDQNGCDGSW
jgi:hypothetical protein